MTYYKIKVQHKQNDHIQRWFFLVASTKEEALEKMIKTCINPETLVDSNYEEYANSIRKIRDY
jgi:hypothetical protein